MSNTWFAAASALAISVAAPIAVQAADVQPAAPSAVGEVVVTALKQGNQNVTRAAASVSVISGQKIEAMGAKNLKDFLQLAPGVSIDDSVGGPGTTNIQIRGINTLFGAASVGFYIDNVPFSLTNLNYLPDVSPFDLNRVEVLKGPQGTLYGAGSSGGVVLVATEDPNMREFHVKAEGEGSGTEGGGGNYKAAAAVNLPLITDKVSLRLVGLYDNESGWIDSSISDRKDINASNSTNLRAKLRITPTDNFTVQLQANVSRTYFDDQNLADDTGHLADFLNDPVNKAFHGSVRYNIYDALVTWRLPWFTINSTTSYFEFTNTGGQAISPTINIPQVFAQHTFEQELRLNSNSQGPFTWVAGALYENITGNEFQYLASIGAPFNLADKIPEKEINLYAQGTLALFDRRLEFTAGISYFSSKFTDIGDLKPAVATPLINSQDTDEFAPKASIAWHPNGRTTLYATYAKGLRAGLAQPAFETFVLRLADPTATGRVMSEIDNSYEVGAKGDFMGGRLHLEGDLFYIDISGPQETAALVIPGVGIPVNTIINAGKARSYGGEWMVAVQPVRGLTASVSGSYANATIAQDFFAPAVGGGTSNLILFRKGDPLDLVPKLTLNGSLVWTHQWGEFEGSASLTGQYSSTRYFTVLSRPPIPGDRIFRLDARYEIGKGPWRVFVFGDNLTNEKGVVGVSVLNNLLPHVGTIGTRLRPRTFGAGLKISY